MRSASSFAITDSLHDAEFDLEENALKLIEFHVDTTYTIEADGLRTHAALIMRSLTEPT
jgi:hypothetical protein